MKNIAIEHFNPTHFQYLVLFDLDVNRKRGVFKKKQFRVKRNFNADEFISDSLVKIETEGRNNCTCSEENRLIIECTCCFVKLSKETMKDSYDDMCPITEKIIKVVDHAP